MEFLIRGRFPDVARPVDVVVRDGKVARVGRAGRTPPDFGSAEAIIGPTLFDIQVNGAFGVNLQGEQLRAEDVEEITRGLAGQGVSCWAPTLVTASLESMEHGCRVIAEAMEQTLVRRAVPGVHLEGPCISPEDGPRGAHPRVHVRPPSLKEFNRLFKAAQGCVLYTTVAPELPGAIPYIRTLTARGVLVSLGHHAASREQIAAAVEAGARLCTHLGNGAAPRMHRHLNPLWPQLAEDHLYASLIADLHHLPPEVLKTFVRAKQPRRIILTSDAVDLAGMKPGHYTLFDAGVELRKDGKICLTGTELLAGSSLMLLQGVVNMWKIGAMTLGEAFASASTIPARLFGLKRRFSLPQPGGRADFLVFNIEETKARSEARVVATFVKGELQSWT
ncbi:MAG: amidohydrolase family protein [Candidatus Hydrogenedentes bacterium]|nr:amidohydrolase family protein [Candidatus Hydrogenedentota bacterium]MBI3117289.1 amidohydrolase family protein [Candidatus Hydrogenedentota bacterium]